MSSFLSDFLAYFLPDIELPAWLQAFVGILLLVLFVKLLMCAIDRSK